MRRQYFVVGLIALAGALALTSAPAKAADSELSAAAELRAGPGDNFPQIKRLAKGLKVDIYGCLQTWDWCDVSWRGARGWVPAAALVDIRENNRIPVAKYGASLGVPKIGFSVGAYWDTYYTTSLWYVDRDVWTLRSASTEF